MAGMENMKRPFTQYDNTISPTQEDNGPNGADDRPIQDNGTQNENFSAGGLRKVQKVDYPLPPDVNAPPGQDGGSDAKISDFGLNESVEVGHDGGIHSYGLAGGEVKQGGADDSIAGQGFGSGSAGGGKTENTKD